MWREMLACWIVAAAVAMLFGAGIVFALGFAIGPGLVGAAAIGLLRNNSRRLWFGLGAAVALSLLAIYGTHLGNERISDLAQP